MFVARALHYFRSHGATATVGRFFVSLKRSLFGKRFMLFYCVLDGRNSPGPIPTGPATIVRLNGPETLSEPDCQRILTVWNPEFRRKQIDERFAKGASLWLYKIAGQVAAYGWSIRGITVEPHFFPLRCDDFHLFDFFVYPEHRGKRINVALVNHIVTELSCVGSGHALIEAAEWNEAQLASISRMPFRALGCARKLNILGMQIVIWSKLATPYRF